MKGQDLFEAMGKISDRYIEEAAPDEKTLAKDRSGDKIIELSEKKRSSRRKWYQNRRFLGGLATAAAVILLTVIVLPKVGAITKYNSSTPHLSSDVGPHKANEGAGKSEYMGDSGFGEKTWEQGVPKETEKGQAEEEEENRNKTETLAGVEIPGEQFSLILNKEGSGIKSISPIACFVGVKKEASSYKVSYITTFGSVIGDLSPDASEQTLSSYLKTTDASTTKLGVPGSNDSRIMYYAATKSEVHERYLFFEEYEESEVRTEDLALDRMIPEGEDEVILVILGYQEDEVTYLVKKSSDPDTEKLFEWYHECQRSP